MEFLLTLSILVIACLGMGVGLLIRNKALRRGCTIDPDGDENDSCGLCGRKKKDCPEKDKKKKLKKSLNKTE